LLQYVQVLLAVTEIPEIAPNWTMVDIQN